MFLNCLVNLVQYGNIGDPGTFTFLTVTTFLMLLGNLLVSLTIYLPKESFRTFVLIRYTYWVPIIFVLFTSGLFITANFDGVIQMEEYNEAYFNSHGENWYECSVWISRFNIAMMFQSAIAVSWFMYVRRYYEWYQQRNFEDSEIVQQPLNSEGKQAQKSE